MKDVILVKLGGSIITNKKIPYTARKAVIARLANELKASKCLLVIAHGSGSFGHTSAVKFGGKKGYKNIKGIAKVAFDAITINQIVMEILIKQGLPVVSLRPMSMMVAKSGKLNSQFFKPLQEVLKQGLIPVFFGDVIWDKNWKSTIYSGETVFNNITSFLRKNGFDIKRIIHVGETNGVYDQNQKTIQLINQKNWPDIKKYVFKLSVNDVTGGMMHKIEDSLIMASKGVESILINGKTKRELAKALLGKNVKGTLIK
ncbi:MAG: hypothetical protein HY344_02840 [Candidatus Levybacteria bacterium]|nr:hypothetical protein [Candidatus Levybacteria bacterium]